MSLVGELAFVADDDSVVPCSNCLRRGRVNFCKRVAPDALANNMLVLTRELSSNWALELSNAVAGKKDEME